MMVDMINDRGRDIPITLASKKVSCGDIMSYEKKKLSGGLKPITTNACGCSDSRPTVGRGRSLFSGAHRRFQDPVTLYSTQKLWLGCLSDV
jgi:hypothetical protein